MRVSLPRSARIAYGRARRLCRFRGAIRSWSGCRLANLSRPTFLRTDACTTRAEIVGKVLPDSVRDHIPFRWREDGAMEHGGEHFTHEIVQRARNRTRPTSARVSLDKSRHD